MTICKSAQVAFRSLRGTLFRRAKSTTARRFEDQSFTGWDTEFPFAGQIRAFFPNPHPPGTSGATAVASGSGKADALYRQERKKILASGR